MTRILDPDAVPPIPIADTKRFTDIATAAVRRVREAGEARGLIAATEPVMLVRDRHPWGDVHWALLPFDYWDAWNATQTGKGALVWQYFTPVLVAVRAPERTPISLRRIAPPRWPATRAQWRAAFLGAGYGAVGSTALLAAAAGTHSLVPAIAALACPPLGSWVSVRRHRRTDSRYGWLTDTQDIRERVERITAAPRSIRAHAVIPSYVIDTVADVADVTIRVVLDDDVHVHAADDLATLHEHLYGLLAAPEVWDNPGLSLLTYSEDLRALAHQVAAALDDHQHAADDLDEPADPDAPSVEESIELDGQRLRDDLDAITARRRARDEIARETRETLHKGRLHP